MQTDTHITEHRSIPVVVDKSHLLTIGEKLYTEKLSFLRELVNNAYDADATEVQVEISPSRIIIRDDGIGMDEDGLRQYFTIGSTLKRTVETSPRYGRRRIGEFGIGKFSALAVCRQFEVETQHGAFRARLLFDKELWSQHEDWHLNIDILQPDHGRANGTIITLHDVTTNFPLGKVRRYLGERTPIQSQHFTLFLNGERVTDEIVTGRKIAIALATRYGPINGTLVITPSERRAGQIGIAVSVKGVLVRYEPFGLETSRKWGVTRLTGRVNADWLPITSNRDDFLRDSEVFQLFHELIRKEVSKALGLIRQEGDRRANAQASRVLKEALHSIGRAMRAHTELFPGATVPLGSRADGKSTGTANGFDISQAEFIDTQTNLDQEIARRLSEQGTTKRRRGRPSAVLGNKSVMRSLKMANLEIAVRLEHLGVDDESHTSGGVIYINIDHPLYRTYHSNDELLTPHLARVITKELALQTGEIDPARAFAIQSELLTTALQTKGKRAV